MWHNLKPINCLGNLYCTDTSDSEGIHRLLKRDVPFIIKNISKSWPAHHLWNLDYFSQKAGHNMVHCVRLDESLLTRYEKLEKMTFFSFLEELRKSSLSGSSSPSAEQLYLVISRLAAHPNRPRPQLPELISDICIPGFIPLERLWTVNLWIGQNGPKSNLHFDPDPNILVAIQGYKELILIPPQSTPLLYQNHQKGSNKLQSQCNIFSPSHAPWPNLDKVSYYQTTLEPQDGLYIPCGWWHAVRSSPGINIAVNFWWLTPLSYLFKFWNPSCSIQWSVKNKWISIMFPWLVSERFKSQA